MGHKAQGKHAFPQANEHPAAYMKNKYSVKVVVRNNKLYNGAIKRKFAVKTYCGFIRLSADWITNQPLEFVLCDKGNAMK